MDDGKKISELEELTEIADDDNLVVVDNDAEETKRMSYKVIKENVKSIIPGVKTSANTSTTDAYACSYMNTRLSNIVNSDTNSDGTYIRFSDGILICIKTIEFTNLNISISWGALYECNAVNLGNWAATFAEAPNVSLCCKGTTVFFEGLNGYDNNSIGTVQLCRPVAGTISTIVSIIGIGTWN